MRHVMKTYGRKSIAFTHGDGAWIYDTSGKRYLDALCGIAVTGLGHNHPKITKAIQEQAGALIHCSNLCVNKLASKAAIKSSRSQSVHMPGGGPPALVTKISTSPAAASTAA